MFYEDWVMANGVDAVESDEKGHVLSVDVLSGCTINISNFTEAVKDALAEKGQIAYKHNLRR